MSIIGEYGGVKRNQEKLPAQNPNPGAANKRLDGPSKPRTTDQSRPPDRLERTDHGREPFVKGEHRNSAAPNYRTDLRERGERHNGKLSLENRGKCFHYEKMGREKGGAPEKFDDAPDLWRDRYGDKFGLSLYKPAGEGDKLSELTGKKPVMDLVKKPDLFPKDPGWHADDPRFRDRDRFPVSVQDVLDILPDDMTGGKIPPDLWAALTGNKKGNQNHDSCGRIRFLGH